MSISKGTPRTTTATNTPPANCEPRDGDAALPELPPVGPGFEGFEVDAVQLPAPPVGVSAEVRCQAAIVILRMIHGHTPEEIASEPSIDALRIFVEDELERAEALAHVDVLAAVLAA